MFEKPKTTDSQTDPSKAWIGGTSLRVRFAAIFLLTAIITQAGPKIKFPKITPKNPHAKSIHSLAIGANGRQLAFGMFGYIQLADDFHTPFSPNPLPGPAGKVNALAFSPDGKTLFAAGGMGKGIPRWRATSGTSTPASWLLIAG